MNHMSKAYVPKSRANSILVIPDTTQEILYKFLRDGPMPNKPFDVHFVAYGMHPQRGETGDKAKEEYENACKEMGIIPSSSLSFIVKKHPLKEGKIYTRECSVKMSCDDETKCMACIARGTGRKSNKKLISEISINGEYDSHYTQKDLELVQYYFKNTILSNLDPKRYPVGSLFVKTDIHECVIGYNTDAVPGFGIKNPAELTLIEKNLPKGNTELIDWFLEHGAKKENV